MHIFQFQGQRPKIYKCIWCSHKEEQARVNIGSWNHQIFMMEKQFQTNMFYGFCLQYVAIVPEDLIVTGS